MGENNITRKYQSGPELIREKTKEIFMLLLEHTPIQVGYLVGLDSLYTTDASIRSGIYKAYQYVLEDPKKYDIPMETVAEVEKRMKERTIGPAKAKAEKKQAKRELQQASTNELIVSSTDRTLALIHQKLDDMERTGALKNVKITDLVKVFSTMFEKVQIVRGEATQNIAILSKSISNDMSADDALEQVLHGRESVAAQKEAHRDK